MNMPAFDTLKYTQDLEDAGMDRTQAEALAEAQSKILSVLMEEKLATKEDLLKVQVNLIKWMVGLVSGWGALLISVMSALKFLH